jgi:predicted amidophosphoribosyltransferase
MSVRALANLFCATCQDTWMHERNVCRRCSTPNNSSGNPPVPRQPKPYGYANIRADQISAAHTEQHQARKRAALARHRLLNQRGASKP